MNYKIYKNILSPEFIKEIFSDINTKQFHQGKVGNRINLEQKRRKDLFINQTKLLSKIDNKIYDSIYDDVKKHFGDIPYRENWKIGHYKANDNGFYNVHSDCAGDTKFRKYSFIAMLSNPNEYEGGEFYFKNLNIQLKLEKGDILIFKSNLLHGVNPVYSGERYVLISFFFDSEGADIKKQLNPNSNLNTYLPILSNTNKELMEGISHLKNEIIETNKNKGDIDYSDLHTHPWSDRDDYYFENNNSKILIISFSGMGWKNSIPTFNFYNMFKSYSHIDKLFLRDIKCRYYLSGLKNSSNTFNETIELINRLTKKKKYDKIIAIGCSAGGYAAILYGQILHFTKVIAFSPQVVLTRTKEELIEDIFNAPKTCQWLRELNKEDYVYQKSLDLKNFIPFQTKVEIHYAKRANKGADKKHALYIEHENCNIIEHDSNNHMIALELRDKGILKKLIENEINTIYKNNAIHEID